MKKCNWTRARSDEQKEQRIKEIISATERLYRKVGYKNITFVDIAKEAGFTRSNLYKYFKSKEEIFLEFLNNDFKNWKNDLINNYKESDYSVDEFIDVWINVLEKNKRLTELTSILYLHLEKEASYDSLLNFKQTFIIDLKQVVDHLTEKIKDFAVEKVTDFIYIQNVIGIGLYQMTDLSDNQFKILERPEFSHWKGEFKQKFIQSTKYILEGLLND